MSGDGPPHKSDQACVMSRVIGPLPPGQGHSFEDMIDHDRSTKAAWCQRGGMGAHRPPAATLGPPHPSTKPHFGWVLNGYTRITACIHIEYMCIFTVSIQGNVKIKAEPCVFLGS